MHDTKSFLSSSLLLDQIDRDGANPERVMQDLSSIGLMPEDWGGDIPMVQVIIYRMISYALFLFFSKRVSSLSA